jgi:hypothetical protein
MSVHVAHPKCADCDRALYKAMEKGAKVRPEDPYAFCRNPSCPQYGYRDAEPTEGEPEAPPEEASAPEAEPEPATDVPASAAQAPPAAPPVQARRLRSRPAGDAPPPPPSADLAEAPTFKAAVVEPEGEPLAVAMARARIKAILEKVAPGKSPAAIGLSLAILNQELGCHAGANALIDEFSLDRFGLQKFTAEGEPEPEAAE